MSKKQVLGDLNRNPDSKVVTLTAPADEEGVTSNSEPVKQASLDKDAVVMVPPSDDSEMEEVSAQTVAARHAPTPVATLSSIVNGLIGKSLPEVREALEDLKNQGRIREFKVVPLGTPMASNAIPGRIQVIKDHADNVLDIVVG